MVNIICSEWIPAENISVQIQKFKIQMVNIICSEWIPLENIRFKMGIFIDWEVAYKPRRGAPPAGLGWLLVMRIV